jgi:hypothetical protein
VTTRIRRLTARRLLESGYNAATTAIKPPAASEMMTELQFARASGGTTSLPFVA